MMKNKSLKKMKRDIEAISPVVATILLVLVAVASAVAFYVFESTWQEEQSRNLDDVDISTEMDYTLVVSGSSTVYEFMTPAAEAYMAANPEATVSVESIGSSGGIAAIVAGACDIGMISESWSTANAAAYPDIVATTIAYDGVVIVIGDSAMTAHGITASNLKNMTSAIIKNVYNPADTTNDTWGELHHALDHNYVIGTVAGDSDSIVTYQRADGSGTEEVFCQKVLDQAKTYLDTTGTDATATGNQGMIDAVSANEDSIGFTSYGMTTATDSTVNAFYLDGDQCTAATIKAEIASAGTGYEAARPLVILTNGQPSGHIEEFVQFVIDPENNREFCSDSGYVSLY